MGKGPAAVILPPERCWSWQAAFPKQLPGEIGRVLEGFELAAPHIQDTGFSRKRYPLPDVINYKLR